MYIDYTYYKTIYDDLDEMAFNRLSFKACQKIENYTTGIDGVIKLRIAFPTSENDAESVKRFLCELIHTMNKIDSAETSEKEIESVSAGSETIRYSKVNTVINAVLSDKKAQEGLYRDIVNDYLLNIADSNGIRLLYMGAYPIMR